MFNHARTLLLNVTRKDNPATTPGEEPVPAEYRVVTLPTYLQYLRGILFGAKPDRLMLNYRGRQLMNVLHLTEFSQFVYDLDPRVTYAVNNDDLFSDVFGITTTPLGGTNTDIYVSGELESPDATGITTGRWRIDVVDSDTVNITSQTGATLVTTTDYTTQSGLSSAVFLPDADLAVRFRPVTGASWRLDAKARPTASLGSIMASLQSYGQPSLSQLFGLGSATGGAEPFKTFRNLWENHHEMSYRLSGMLLAYIYRIEALRHND